MSVDDATAAAHAALIARDSALPLATLLDDDALASWLAPGHGSAPVRRRYLRYKPGSSCVVLAETVHRGEPTSVAVTGVAAEGQAKAVKALGHARPQEVVAAEPEAGLVAVLPSADRHLPGLRRLLREPSEVMARVLHRPVAVASVTPLAYKPHRRWVGRVDLDGGESVLVRAYRSGHAAPHRADLQALAGSRAPVPQLLGHRGRRDLLALAWVPGEVLDGVVQHPLSGAVLDAVGSAGSALARLHRTSGEPAGAPWRVDVLGTAAEAVGVALPALAGTAARLAARIVDALPASAAALAHGDFSLDQVVVGIDGPRLLDLDRLVAAPAALDLGTAAAALLTDPARADLTGPVLEALLAGYGEHAEVPSPRELEVHTAAALLTRAIEPFRVCEPGWPTQVARNLRHAHEVLQHGLDVVLGRICA